ncbi:MAG TPA: BrnT family toxin [Bradyrhizobium sp.]|nr:BrnT family toxin [Bradyrhizobium sp.]
MADFELLSATGFEWDEVKSNANLTKHGISFEDASEIFYEPVVVKESSRNSEERWIAIGKSHDQIVTVIFTRREDLIRIISARRPRPDEKRAYRNATMGRSSQGKD